MKQRLPDIPSALLNNIKLLVLDVDGVLTNGDVGFTSAGEEIKTFTFLDIMGLSLARKAGFRLALVSGEQGKILEQFSQKLGIVDLFQDCRDKLKAVQEVCAKYDISPEETCFVGDDVNDLPALSAVGLPITVPNAHPLVLKGVPFVTERFGGGGAVREIADLLIAAKNRSTPPEERVSCQKERS